MSSSLHQVRLVLVADRGGWLDRLVRRLPEAGYDADVSVPGSESEFSALAGENFDVILADLGARAIGARRALEICAASSVGVPLIVLSKGTTDEVVAECMRDGAADYLRLPELTELAAAIGRALERAKGRRERRRATAALREREKRLTTISDLGSDYAYSIRIDLDGTVVTEWVTDALFRISGYSPAEIERLGGGIGLIHPDDRVGALDRVRRLLAGERDVSEYRIVTRGGDVRWLRDSAVPEWEEGRKRVMRICGAAQDITDRKRAEAELAAALQQRKNVMATIPDVLYTIDRAGRLVDWNRRLERVSGIAPEDMPGRSALDFFIPEDQERVAEAIRQGFAEGYAAVDAGLIHTDGSVRPHHFSGVPLLDDSGAVVGLTGVGRDITERVQAETTSAALAAVGHELVAGFGTPDLVERLCRVTVDVLGCDSAHTLIFVPEKAAYVPIAGHGYAPELWESLRLLEIPSRMLDGSGEGEVRQRERESIADAALRQLADQIGITAWIRMPLHRSNETIGLHVACYLRGPGLRFSPLQERIARSIAQLASMAMEHARTVDALDRASRLKSEFVATISHELRTPLNVILGYHELLADGAFGDMNAQQNDALARANGNARELLTLINDTLDLSRLEAGQVALHLTETEVSAIAREIETELAPGRTNAGLAMIWEVPDDLPVLRTDPLKLKVVLKNLLGNAFKFTAEGHVRMVAHAEGEQIVIGIEDTGEGISEAALPHIFEPFRQADGSTTRRHGGVGLGLHIVRRLLDLLGGTISVQSEVGRGSRFTVRLPLRAGNKTLAA